MDRVSDEVVEEMTEAEEVSGFQTRNDQNV